MRESGILMPVFSLPSSYGIGSFSHEAYEFVDFLEKAGQSKWQILPLGETGFGNSPYASLSSFAGNPYFVSLEDLMEEGLLTYDEVNQFDWGSDVTKVDYGAMYNCKKAALRIAWNRFREGNLDAFQAYIRKNEKWLNDYALFMILKNLHGGKAWMDWEEEYKLRNEKALQQVKSQNEDEYYFYCFIQYKFDEQWNALHAYAHEHNVDIIGDVPFFAALDSVDVWSEPEVFGIDQEGKPAYIAGTAPDAFSPTGQLWGNPVYDWKYLKKKNYDWWMERLARNFDLYDVLRFDHFQGFISCYGVPYGEKTAEKGKVMPGPGKDFFTRFDKEFHIVKGKDKDGNLKLIAEDLGAFDEDRNALIEEEGIMSMKILEYAFTTWNSIYMPHRLNQNCVIYTGNHDNAPLKEWFLELNEGTRNFARSYIHSENTDEGGFVWDMIREAYHSTADLCIVPLYDYLVKGEEARLNIPGSSAGNWEWRLEPDFLSEDLAHSIRKFAEIYARIPDRSKKQAEEKKTAE